MPKKHIEKPVKKKEDEIIVKGKVIEALPNAMFRVELENSAVVLCTIKGKLRQKNIRILPDDIVEIGISPYDLTRGRIHWRFKDA